MKIHTVYILLVPITIPIADGDKVHNSIFTFAGCIVLKRSAILLSVRRSRPKIRR